MRVIVILVDVVIVVGIEYRSWCQLHYYLVKVAWAGRRAHRSVLLNIFSDVNFILIRLIVLVPKVFQGERRYHVV